jgi:hypothetical protein
MSSISRTYTPGNIFLSSTDIYVGLTLPTSSLVPTADANTLTLDASGQPTSSTGFHAGLIEAPTMPVFTEKCNEIHADQFEMAVDIAFDSINAEIDVILKETQLSNLKTLMTNNSLVTYTALSGLQVLQFGGASATTVNATTITAIGTQRGNAGKFAYVCLFACVLGSALQMTFHRQKENSFKAKLHAFADLTRQPGDELANIVMVT